MLKLEHIAKTFNPGTINEKHAIRDLSLELADGDFVTVIGGNGAGKSTLLNAVAGVWPVDAGSIFIGGEDVTGMPEYKRAQFIGRVFQDPMMGTAPNMQIEENLALANRRGKRRGLRWGVTQTERENYRQLLTGLGLGLEKRMTAKVGLLSGGQRQALTLLMAVMKKPKVLLLDEHTAALDPKTAAKVLEISKYDLNDPQLGKLELSLNKLSDSTNDTIVTLQSRLDYLSSNFNDLVAIEYVHDPVAPITAGEVMATLTYYPEEGEPIEYELVASRSVSRRVLDFPSLDELIADTLNDPNPFPRFTVEIFLFLVAVVAVIWGVVKGVKRLMGFRSKKPRRKAVKPISRYYR